MFGKEDPALSFCSLGVLHLGAFPAVSLSLPRQMHQRPGGERHEAAPLQVRPGHLVRNHRPQGVEPGAPQAPAVAVHLLHLADGGDLGV